MDDLDAWLGTSLGPEHLRAEVRQACGGSLEDLRSCELEDLESELSLSTWPPLERQRFLSAWRGLRGENDDDDAAADDAAADTDEEPAAAPRPPSPAPAPEPVSPPPPTEYQVGDQVEARWKGGERYYPALVLVARVDGSVDLRYTDDDTESRVPPMLLRPLARRRGRARRAPPPAPVAESSDAESEPAPAEPEPLASPMAEEPSDAESEPAAPNCRKAVTKPPSGPSNALSSSSILPDAHLHSDALELTRKEAVGTHLAKRSSNSIWSPSWKSTLAETLLFGMPLRSKWPGMGFRMINTAEHALVWPKSGVTQQGMT